MARTPGPIDLQLLQVVDQPPPTGGRGSGIAERLADLMADVAPGKWAVVARGDVRVTYKRLNAAAIRARFEVRTDGAAVYVRARTEPYVPQKRPGRPKQAAPAPTSSPPAGPPPAAPPKAAELAKPKKAPAARDIATGMEPIRWPESINDWDPSELAGIVAAAYLRCSKDARLARKMLGVGQVTWDMYFARAVREGRL